MTKEPVIRALDWSGDEPPEELVTREWIVTNGRGGYASGSISGVPTRRFHGLLVAALPTPIGRAMMLNHLFETLVLEDGTEVRLGGYEREQLEVYAAPVLREFRLDHGLPVWRFELGSGAGRLVLEKRVRLVHLQNTAQVTFTVVEGDAKLHLELRPSVCFRPHEGAVSGAVATDYSLGSANGRYEIKGPAPYPCMRLAIAGDHPSFTIDGQEVHDIVYRIEKARGYDYQGTLWSPGFFRADLAKGHDVVLTASTESWEAIEALDANAAVAAEAVRRHRLTTQADPRAATELGRELTFAADQFIITPASRVEDETRARAGGDEVRTVIAGYHWFTDWGRDTMISLEGLTLTTGRHEEAGYILRTFGRYVRDGLIPNMFPEGKSAGLYHTADASLWFFHAVERYLQATGDRLTLQILLPALTQIFTKHMEGTLFGIGVDPADGLLRQGAEGYQLTWMDAKVGDWVVTPRRGKAVEINALFYNACRLLARWLDEEGDAVLAKTVSAAADRVETSFNERFWYAEGNYLYDVIDGPDGTADSALRPNQVFAIALEHPVLDRARWKPVMDLVEKELVTPVGLRSLARSHPDYKPRYDGDLRARDAAYHQGTVWSWLIGPFLDAWLALNPGRLEEASRFLAGFGPHLSEAGVGSISEVFDAEPPFTPRGCMAQAWGVAEVLRCLVKTRPGG